MHLERIWEIHKLFNSIFSVVSILFNWGQLSAIAKKDCTDKDGAEEIPTNCLQFTTNYEIK